MSSIIPTRTSAGSVAAVSATATAPAAAAVPNNPNGWRCVDADTSNMYVAVRNQGGGLQCAGPDRLRCTYYEDPQCTTIVSWSDAPSTANGFGGTVCKSYTQSWCLAGSDPKAGVPLAGSWSGGIKSMAAAPTETMTQPAGPSSAQPTQDSGVYYIEPHGVNSTTTTMSSTKTYVIFYATYNPSKATSTASGPEPPMSSDRITLISLVTILCVAVIATVGATYYVLKKRRKEAMMAAKFGAPDEDGSVGEVEPGQEGDFYDGSSSQLEGASVQEGEEESYYEESEDGDSVDSMPLPAPRPPPQARPMSGVALMPRPVSSLGRPMSGVPRPISGDPRALGLGITRATSPNGDILPPAAAPAPATLGNSSTDVLSPSWDTKSTTSSRPSGMTSPSAGEQARASAVKTVHQTRLARPLSRYDNQMVMPTEATNEMRELALWLAQDLSTKKPSDSSS